MPFYVKTERGPPAPPPKKPLSEYVAEEALTTPCICATSKLAPQTNTGHSPVCQIHISAIGRMWKERYET